MSRRIGNFYEEKTGETHWLEPETVKDYALPPGRIAELNQNGYTAVSYQLSSNEEEETIELVASILYGLPLDKDPLKISSTPVSMHELLFAEILFDSYVNDQTFAIRDEVKEYTDAALKSLALQAFDQGVILDGLELADGFGAVLYDEDTVAVFDGIDIKVEPYENAVSISLTNVVSQATLLSEKLPKIQYQANGKKLLIDNIEIIEVTEGLVKQYKLTTNKSSISVSDETQGVPVLQQKYTADITSESSYMTERFALLSSADLEEENFDDRFEEIFSL